MFKKSLVLTSLIGTSFMAQAVTVDLRHEYIDSGANADRVSVSHRFANGVGFSVEAKWKSGGDKADQYSFDNGFYVAARYRYEYTRYPSSSNKDDDKVNRGDAWVGWVMGDWRTELNYVYAKSSEGMVRNNNKDYSNEYNAKLAYKWDKNWAPYVEVGNIGVKDTDERQTRLRLGVAYSF